MSIDLSQFYSVFFEEAAEHLATMESLLLGLDVGAPDAEDVNAIFRAAHSIKGASATFGFSDMADLTHVMETLLDKARKGQTGMSRELVDACLAAGDVLKNLLGAHRGEAPADSTAVAAIRLRLERVSADLASPPVPPAEAPARGNTAFELRFIPDPAIEPGDEQAAAIVEELACLGTVSFHDRPRLGSGQPWRVSILSGLEEAALRGVAEFLALPGSVELQSQAAERTDDGACGFFTEAPLTAPVEAPAPVPASAGEEAEDGSWGLFEPIEAAPPAPAAKAKQPVARAGVGDSSIRVSVDKVDQMINLVGELVITQAMLQQTASALDTAPGERLLTGLAQLQRNTRELQEAVLSIRMLPISVVFNRFPRMVRDLSSQLGKIVELMTSGEGTELDKGLVERIADPLTHLVRNSLDHGIESPEIRRAAGKSATGILTLKAYHQGGHIVIEVGDDGAGLDRARILAKARERGFAAADTMGDAEVWQLIFEPGFSTAEQITEVSGRGVGMDVVRRDIAKLSGRVEVESMPGIGTRTTVRLPLTLAILDGMSVAVGAETYILPLNAVVESLQPTAAMIRSLAGRERLLRVRGEYLPVICLREIFKVDGGVEAWSGGIMVVLEADGHKAALFVDALMGQQQVVIKSLETHYRRVEGVSGATIMGDGRVALILDVAALVGLTRRA